MRRHVSIESGINVVYDISVILSAGSCKKRHHLTDNCSVFPVGADDMIRQPTNKLIKEWHLFNIPILFSAGVQDDPPAPRSDDLIEEVASSLPESLKTSTFIPHCFKNR